jgi:hypothetical protein
VKTRRGCIIVRNSSSVYLHTPVRTPLVGGEPYHVNKSSRNSNPRQSTPPLHVPYRRAHYGTKKNAQRQLSPAAKRARGWYVSPTATSHNPHSHLASVAHPSSQFAIPANLNEFATLRRFHTRTSVPEPAAHLWSLLTKHYLTLWSQAAPSEKHAACIRFLMLPHLFLPKSVSNNRIVRHLEMADPFHLNLENINSDRRTRQSQSHQRLSEAVTRLVSDRKLGAANKLLHNVTETDELSFDEKVDQMKKKILDGNFSSTIPKENIPIVTAHEVTKAIRKANRNAANAILLMPPNTPAPSSFSLGAWRYPTTTKSDLFASVLSSSKSSAASSLSGTATSPPRCSSTTSDNYHFTPKLPSPSKLNKSSTLADVHRSAKPSSIPSTGLRPHHTT